MRTFVFSSFIYIESSTPFFFFCPVDLGTCATCFVHIFLFFFYVSNATSKGRCYLMHLYSICRPGVSEIHTQLFFYNLKKRTRARPSTRNSMWFRFCLLCALSDTHTQLTKCTATLSTNKTKSMFVWRLDHSSNAFTGVSIKHTEKILNHIKVACWQSAAFAGTCTNAEIVH